MAAAVGANSLGTLNGFFKDVFASTANKVVPECAEFQKGISFETRNRLGEKFSQPVQLTRPHGFTYETGDAGAFELNAPVASIHKEATLVGSEIVLREYIPYKVAASGVSSKQAFASSVGHIVTGMTEAARFRNECSLIYGGRSLADTFTVTGTSTTRVFTFADKDWAPFLWAGAETAKIDVYTSTSTLVNSNADIVITAVDIDSRTLSVSGNATDLTAVDALTGGDARVYWKGSFGKEMTGLYAITGSTGSLFGVDGAVYGLWAGNSYGVGSVALDLDKVAKGFALATNKGAKKLRYKLHVSPNTFSDLNADQSALRAYDSSYGPEKGKNGFQQITYYCTAGEVEIIPNAMIQGGFALGVCYDHFMRLGSTDLSYSVPGSNERFLNELPDHAGYSLRTYTDQALFCEKPGLQVRFTGIVNTA